MCSDYTLDTNLFLILCFRVAPPTENPANWFTLEHSEISEKIFCQIEFCVLAAGLLLCSWVASCLAVFDTKKSLFFLFSDKKFVALKVVKSAAHYTETALDEIKLLKCVSGFYFKYLTKSECFMTEFCFLAQLWICGIRFFFVCDKKI